MKEYTVKVYGNKTEWHQNGLLHREDGPAVEWACGTKKWYLNGKFHREDGAAVERADGYKSWWLNGKRHREDGPAIEWECGRKGWYLNGKYLTEKEFNARMNPVELTLDEIASKFGIPVSQLKIKK
jgi:hypothetical protein